jgi:hypothetical protein
LPGKSLHVMVSPLPPFMGQITPSKDKPRFSPLDAVLSRFMRKTYRQEARTPQKPLYAPGNGICEGRLRGQIGRCRFLKPVTASGGARLPKE